MDNCAGTNKSQFLFGALAVMVMLGELDAITIEFMLPGHTKMWLDWVFSKTGQAFRRLDAFFNHGMLGAIFLLLKRPPKICVLNDPPRGQ